jgi:hypothetical protein
MATADSPSFVPPLRAVPDVDEAALAIDQRNGETHGIGQRHIQRIAPGNMSADLMYPINLRSESAFVSSRRSQSSPDFFSDVGSDSANLYSAVPPIAAWQFLQFQSSRRVRALL